MTDFSLYLYIFSSFFTVSVQTLRSHYSTHLALPLLFLPVSGCLMVILLLLMFSVSVGKSKQWYTLSKIYFNDWKNQKYLAIQTKFCRSSGQRSLKHIKPGLSQEPELVGSLIMCQF